MAKSDDIKLIWFTNNVYKFYFIEYNLFDHCINLSVFQSIPAHKKIKFLLLFIFSLFSDVQLHVDVSWDFYPLV